MRIVITLRGSSHAPSEFIVSDFVPTTYGLRFKLEDETDPERLHHALGGAGYSSRDFALTTDRGQTYSHCRISTETGREIGVDFRSQS
jgi:hypothetical protein